jgi:FkbM family methyltransferase
MGLELVRRQPPASTLRPIGSLTSILEDVRARRFEPRVIFDVGASDGAWTRLVEPIFPGASFVLVEPRPSMAPALDAYCRDRSACVGVHAAVGPSEGNALLTDWNTGSTLLSVDAAGAPQIPVVVTTLDVLADRYGSPDIVKLDIEGYELEALKGATRILGRTELLILEVAMFRFVERPIFHDVVAFLADRNYVLYDIAAPIRRPVDGALGLLDVCFARRQGQLRSSDRWS